MYTIINPENDAILGVVTRTADIRPFCRAICHDNPTPETHVWVLDTQKQTIKFRFIGLTTKNGHRRMAHLENLFKSPPTCHHAEVYRRLMVKNTIAGKTYEIEEHNAEE